MVLQSNQFKVQDGSHTFMLAITKSSSSNAKLLNLYSQLQASHDEVCTRLLALVVK